MDEPARKRRRTNSPLERESSPLRKPPRRPSFASPTKASLARNYPNLLPSRPTSSGSPSRPSSRGDALGRGKQARAFVLGETDVQEALDQGAKQHTQNVTPRAHRVTGPNSTSDPQRTAEEEDPELPATPSQQGLGGEDGPRRGILFSSPSKRPPRAKNLVKQSPLRPKADPPPQATTPEQAEDTPIEEDATELQKVALPDPEIEKRKREKARLQHELTELEAQTMRCAEEIARESRRALGATLRSAERSELNEFIAIISGLDTQEEKPAPISSLLCSFLPFSSVVAPRPPPAAQEKPVPSHRPIELADPLPYLEMFTSLQFSTRLSLPDDAATRPGQVFQKHTIDISGPQRLLTAQISLTINTTTHEITSMSILDLSPWATRDLGKYLDLKAQENDLSNACWAIETYWTLASKRAQYWHRCETTFAHLIHGPASEDTENSRPQPQKSGKFTRRNLMRHLGRETWILQDKHVLLKLNWRIAFDWTGEAESYVTVEPAFPSVWTEREARKTFDKVPATFSALIKTKGAFEATRGMVTLLFAR